MEQRVSMISFPVADVPAARALYERLGWTVTFTDGDIVMFQAGGMVLSLWWREKLDADGGVADRGGYGSAALAYAVRDAETVDAVVRDAVDAGATVTREPVEKPLGYSGVFADPDGHTWEVAGVRSWTLHDDGSVGLGIDTGLTEGAGASGYRSCSRSSTWNAMPHTSAIRPASMR